MGLSQRNLHILLYSPEMLAKRNNFVIEIGLGSPFTLTSGIQRGKTSFPVVLLMESDEDCFFGFKFECKFNTGITFAP